MSPARRGLCGGCQCHLNPAARDSAMAASGPTVTRKRQVRWAKCFIIGQTPVYNGRLTSHAGGGPRAYVRVRSQTTDTMVPSRHGSHVPSSTLDPPGAPRTSLATHGRAHGRFGALHPNALIRVPARGPNAHASCAPAAGRSAVSGRGRRMHDRGPGLDLRARAVGDAGAQCRVVRRAEPRLVRRA